MTKVSNRDSVIDSRDVTERITELKDAIDTEQSIDWDELLDDDLKIFTQAILDIPERAKVDTEDIEELHSLLLLESACAGYVDDWEFGATLVRDDYFTDYAKELLKDCGELPQDMPSYIVIDWDRTADNIMCDYFSVDFGGVEYWVR